MKLTNLIKGFGASAAIVIAAMGRSGKHVHGMIKVIQGFIEATKNQPVAIIKPISTTPLPLKRFVIAGSVGAITLVLIYVERKPIGDTVREFYRYIMVSVRTVIINRCLIRNECCAIRHQFRTAALLDRQPNAIGHSHPAAAQLRTNADNFITHLIQRMGLSVWCPNMSVRDQRYNLFGARPIYWAKDTIVKPCPLYFKQGIRNIVYATLNFITTPLRFINSNLTIKLQNPNDNYVVKMIDDDYYYESPGKLLPKFTHALLYTMIPKDTSGIVPDGAYNIVDDILSVKISGGAHYEHALWDFNADMFTVRRWYGTDLYAVEDRPQLGSEYSVIGLFYIGTVYGLAGYLLPQQPLKRRTFSRGSFSYNIYYQNGEVRHSFSTKNVWTRMSIPDHVYHSARIRTGALLATNKAPSMADIERILHGDSKSIVGNIQTVAAALWQMLCETPNFDRTLEAYPKHQTGQSWEAYHYQAIAPLFFDNGKPSMRRLNYYNAAFTYAKPIAPANSFNNDVAAVTGRITELANDTTFDNVPTIYRRLAMEFVEFIVRDHIKHTLVPFDEHSTNERLVKPAQKAKWAPWRFFANAGKFFVKSFQKRECYGKITAPRIISTVPEDHKRRLASFLYSFETVLKSKRWYAFSKQPNELFDSIHEYHRGKHICIDTDFSRFDGHYCLFFQQLNHTIMATAFSPQYHRELEKLLKDEVTYNGVTKFGHHYYAGTSTPSGSPRTSAFNSLVNCFISYCAIKLSTHANLSNDVIDNMVGFYGGDDGIVCDVDPEKILTVCKQLKMVIKLDVKHPGDAVPFLGRLLINPWSGPCNVADVSRQLRKFFMTTAEYDVPDNDVLYRKSEAYLITDPKTPVLTNLCKYFLRNITPSTDKKVDYSWFASFNELFPAPYDDDKVYSVVAANLGVTVDVLIDVDSRLVFEKSFEEINKLLNFSELNQVKFEIPATYDGQVGGIDKTTGPINPVATPAIQPPPVKPRLTIQRIRPPHLDVGRTAAATGKNNQHANRQTGSRIPRPTLLSATRPNVNRHGPKDSNYRPTAAPRAFTAPGTKALLPVPTRNGNNPMVGKPTRRRKRRAKTGTGRVGQTVK